jgi:hypothetical protein
VRLLAFTADLKTVTPLKNGAHAEPRARCCMLSMDPGFHRDDGLKDNEGKALRSAIVDQKKQPQSRLFFLSS